jgi:hypothetical protein
MIRAGHLHELAWDSGAWIFLDIGFSEKSRSCGLLIEDGTPTNLTFSDAVAKITHYISTCNRPVNLTIEAPLSVAFTREGNPTGRSVEKQPAHNPRYWYLQGGCAVMVASLYLIRAIADSDYKTEVRMFEGFVSFKPRSVATDHSKDVELLRDIVRNPVNYPSAIVSPEDLKKRYSDKLQSAFSVMGMDLGVPPIIKS